LLLFAADATIEHAQIKVREIEQMSDAPMPLPKRDWLEMTWQDIADAATEHWIAVLPLAAIEQHGPHLPLGVDSFIAEAYLGRVRELLPDDLPVTFLPIQRVGISD
jgi:creatinine amidohydrolase